MTEASRPLAFLCLLSVCSANLLAGIGPSLESPLVAASPELQGGRGSEADRVLKTITRWLKLYRKGDLKLASKLVGTKSLLKKADLEHLRGRGSGGFRGRGGGAGPGGRQQPPTVTPKSELQDLLSAAADIRTPKAYALVLEIAAIGLDTKFRYTTDMKPSSVRQLGEQRMVGMSSRDEVFQFLVAAAKGEVKGGRGIKKAMQIAAMRVLSRGEREVDLRIFEGLLKSSDGIMRLAAAEAIGLIGRGYCVEWLAAALEQENAPTTMIALVWSIRDVHQRHRKTVKSDHLRRAVIAAGAHLGSVVQRPTGNALVDFLATFRYQDSVPGLIGLLERLNTDRSLSRADKLTAAMAQRVNDVLQAMTGAILPKDDPAQWRKFWAAEGSKIDVTKIAKKKTDARDGGTVSGFFGIPIRGRRIVFIIDFSGSMDWLMPQEAGGTSASRDRGKIKKIAKAKQELLQAVNSLGPQHKFNVVRYSMDVRKWQKGLVPATKKYKKSLARYLQGQEANGGTNLFGGLKSGLEMKSLVYGSRYDSHVDEIFILSDGVPTVGDVTNMAEILRLVGETNRYSGVRINSIYLGSKSNERRPGNGGRSEREGGEFLKKLADQNGGQFAWPITEDAKDSRGRGRRR